jgi:hypothetical protein
MFLMVLAVLTGAVSYLGMRTVLIKVGYSGRWAYVVPAPFLVAAIGFLIVAAESHPNHPLNRLDNLGVLTIALWALIFVVWIMCLVLAFAAWPNFPSKFDTWKANTTAREVERTTLRMVRSAQPPPEPTTGPATPMARPIPDVSTDSSLAGPTTYCPRCGTSMTTASAYFHDCHADGPATQFCTVCGSATVPGAESCAECHTPTA